MPSRSANNSDTTGAMVPLLTLGIPGGGATAVGGTAAAGGAGVAVVARAPVVLCRVRASSRSRIAGPGYVALVGRAARRGVPADDRVAGVARVTIDVQRTKFDIGDRPGCQQSGWRKGFVRHAEAATEVVAGTMAPVRLVAREGAAPLRSGARAPSATGPDAQRPAVGRHRVQLIGLAHDHALALDQAREKAAGGKAMDVVKAAGDAGLLMLVAGPDVVRIAPSLVIGLDEILEGLARLEAAVNRALA